MEILQAFWSNVTDAQATILNGLLTVLAAIGGVLLGNKLFKGKLASLEQAMGESEERIDGHVRKLEALVEQVGDTSTKTAERVIQLAGDRVDSPAHDDGADQQERKESEDAAPISINDQASMKEKWLSEWKTIQRFIEECASNSSIDGRRRARYVRIDRRSYTDLIGALVQDGNLSGGEEIVSGIKSVVSDRQRLRNGRVEVTQSELARIVGVAKKIRQYEPSELVEGGVPLHLSAAQLVSNMLGSHLLLTFRFRPYQLWPGPHRQICQKQI